MSLLIVGAGEQGRVVLEAARAAGLDPLGFLHPENGSRSATSESIDGLPILGFLDQPDGWRGSADSVGFVVALGDNQARAAVYGRCLAMGLTPIAVVHPRAIVLGGAQIGPGAVVAAGAVVGVAARVGPNAIINTAASIDHDNLIGTHAHVAPGAHLAGRVIVDEGAFIGVGAAVRDGIRIGAWSIVAAGAAVASDVGGGLRVAGVPARPMDGP
jgi:sugar O-acyltransferase (sialic acid O-acetyltransferase NeuD family)